MDQPAYGVKAIFDRALEIDTPADRRAFLDEACAGALPLRDQVESLLNAYAQAGSFLEQPAGADVRTGLTLPAPLGLPPVEALPTIERPGTHLGPYHLVQPMGAGGMGTVWRARQEVPVRREVALKVIKPGYASAGVIARFEAERQTLALMDHPNIAKVLDASSTPAGGPYFVMELVPGVPITQFCDEHALSPRQRLELFIPVCRAVQHAHQKGVVHRDLKPSNVLVALYDGQPIPKVIDFGIAKATEAPLTEQALVTACGAVVGTLEYMAPEQADANQLDVDTRADIYSLGVLLYELLTGSTPRRGRLKGARLLEVLHLIREQEPERPSARLSAAATVPAVAAARGTAPTKLARLMKGELDWIVLKCLERDRARRYVTANGLARDLERYLADEPVEAGPPSATYRLRKLARRHKGPVIAAALVLSALVMGIVGTTWGLLRAEARQREARAVLDFFEKLVGAAAQPKRERGGLGKDVTLRAAIDATVPEIERMFAGQPTLEAAIRHAVGQSYILCLEEPALAIPQFDRAFTLRCQLLGPDHPDTLASMNGLALAYRDAGQPGKAVPLWEQLRAKQQEQRGFDHPDTLATLDNLAGAYKACGRLDNAVSLFEQAVAERRRTLGADNPETLSSMNNLASAYQAADHPDKAVQLFEQTLAKRRAKLGPDHPGTLITMHNLASAYQAAGQLEKAIQLFEQALEKRRQNLGPGHPGTLVTMNHLARAYQADGQPKKAVPLFEQALAKRQAKLGPDHAATLKTMNGLAIAYQQDGDFARAEQLLRDCLALRERKELDAVMTWATRSQLGGCLLRQQKYTEAECLLLEAYEGMKRHETTHPVPDQRHLTETLERLVRCCEARGKRERADAWRQRLAERTGAKAP